MSRVGTVWPVAAAALAGLLLAAAAASAQPWGPEVSLPAGAPPQLRALVEDAPRPSGRDSFRAGFSLTTRNGYRLTVLGFGESVLLAVEDKDATTATAYVARGTVTPGRLQASFGRFGRLSMRFRPSRNRTWVKPHRRCHGGGRFVNRNGVYVGVLRFKGEDDYVSVDAHRAKGGVGSVAAKCLEEESGGGAKRATSPSAEGPSGPEPAFLAASWRAGVSSAGFVGLTSTRRALFIAVTQRTEGRIAILRVALALGLPAALKIDDALTYVRASPPAPFSGTGTYRAAPDGTTTWEGSLAVDFPGAPNTPLAGPPFKASLDAGF
jgi:hypothetical protein